MADSLETQYAAEASLNCISKPLNLAITNGHLWPQTYLTKGKKYNLIVDTNELAWIPDLLTNLSNKYLALKTVPFPQLNKTHDEIDPIHWNDKHKLAFYKTYKVDLMLYEGITGTT